MAFTFDGANKLVILSAGTTLVDLAEMYSRWKDWLLLGNTGYARAFDTVGGEPIDPGAGTMVPLFLFLQNGWKVRPYEANHTLTVAGGSLIGSGGGDPFADTLGNYRVRIRYQQPVQAFGYSTTGAGGATPADVADAVVAKALGARSLGAHIQAIAATAVGETTGAGTSHMAFTDGPVTVEADVPLPGVAGDRTNVVITGV